MDYSDELKKLTNKELEDIVIKGENINVPNSRASTAKRILDYRLKSNVNSLNTALFSNAASISKSLESATASLVAVNTISDIITNNLAKAIAIPTLNFENLFSAIESVQSIAGTAAWQDVVKSATTESPMLKAVEMINSMDLSSVKKFNLPQSLPTKLPETIKEIEAAGKDEIYNFPAYEYLFRLETFLRKFIKERIMDPNMKIIESKIPSEMIEKWREKETDEKNNSHVVSGSYNLIDYSDFTDLKTILEKNSTVKLLHSIISEENIKTITSKLLELEPIRLKLAHSRILTREEFDTIEMYSKKIIKILPLEINV